LSLVGPLLNCGIKTLSDSAIGTAHYLRDSGLSRTNQEPWWNDEETIELLTRASVRDDMKALLSGKLNDNVIEELRDVLFGILYPTYDKREDV
jgi:hypothetical protein